MKLKDIVSKINKYMTPSVEITHGSGYKRYHDTEFGKILKDFNSDAEVTQIYVSIRSVYNIPMLCIHIKEVN